MRKSTACFLFFVISLTAFGQKTFLDKAADSTCRCLEAAKEKIKSEADFDKFGQACVVKAALPYLEGIAKEENIPIEELNEDIGEKLGRKIGMKLISSCSAFLELISAYTPDDKESDIISGKTTGIVTSVELTGQVYLNIKESSGKIIKVLWLEYFPGSDEFKNDPAALKGRKVEVEWKQIEIYNVVQKDFSPVKQINKLSVK